MMHTNTLDTQPHNKNLFYNIRIKYWVVPVIFLLFPQPILSAQLDVAINEVAWMGTIASTNDEWIELKNNTNQEIDLTDWTIEARDGSPKIILSGTVPANGYYLLERGDDDLAISDITANQTYSRALGNNGEELLLKDASGATIDSLLFSLFWPSGDNETKSSMERINSLTNSTETNWATNNKIIINGLDSKNNKINGTPGRLNSAIETITPPNLPEKNPQATTTEPLPPIDSPEPEKTQQIDYSKIIINELMPNAPKEWVELLNTDDADISLADWQLKDNANNSKKFGEEDVILSDNLFVINFDKSILNNDGDKLSLITPDGQIL